MRTAVFLFLTASFVAGPVVAREASATSDSDASVPSEQQSDRKRVEINIYPILAWAPIFGASVNLPQFPNFPPGPAGAPSGTVSGSFNGAAFAGVEVLTRNWAGVGDGLWAGMSAERTNPLLNVKLDVILADGSLGRRVYKDLFVTGGFRRMALSFDVKFINYPDFSRKPGVWDPLLGISWRHRLGRKWRLIASIDGGGFGVGSDVDVSAKFRADWRFTKHFGTSFGYGALHFKISDTVVGRTFTATQTMNGPIFGFGIYI
jgi:hypothetical protein